MRHFTRGRKARLEHQLHDILVRQHLVGADQAKFQSLGADRRKIHAGAVIAHFDDHLGALALQVQVDMPGLLLAEGEPVGGQLDAVHHGIAQHVLERRQHALEHLPIELARGALDDQLGALAGIARRLAHDARQTLHVALHRNHAGAHEPVLQLGDGARLLLQQILCFRDQALEQSLDARDVVGRFGQGARELLDR